MSGKYKLIDGFQLDLTLLLGRSGGGCRFVNLFGGGGRRGLLFRLRRRGGGHLGGKVVDLGILVYCERGGSGVRIERFEQLHCHA